MRLALTKRSGDAIRMLLHLAAQPPGARLTSAQLATAAEVSAGNVPTLVATMARGGLLDCTPGRNGGCRLARPAEEITIADGSTQCVYDMRFVMDDKAELVEKAIDLCKLGIFTLSDAK